jgi:tetratricopeptide (TPR) repeat protein
MAGNLRVGARIAVIPHQFAVEAVVLPPFSWVSTGKRRKRMQFLKLGATAIATGVVVALTMSPAAVAQKPPTLTKQVVGPLNEARTALVAKDWATAKTKLDAASTQAKTPYDKLMIEKMTIVMAAETKNGPEQVRSIEAMVATGLLTPEETKTYKGALIKAYADAGDAAKSTVAYRAYVDAYGGTHDQYAQIAIDLQKQNDNAGSVTYANKAIETAKAAGAAAPETYFIIAMKAHKAMSDMDKYYATEEQLVAAHPKEIYWKELIAGRTQEAPKFGGPIRLDMFRALQAAKLPLSVNEKRVASGEALRRGLPTEAVAILEPAVTSGELSTPEDQESLKNAKKALADDKVSLPKEITQQLAKTGNGQALANIGEAAMSHGDYAQAIDLIQKGIERGISDPGELDIAKLHLGIAQYRAGQKDAAVKSWADVKTTDNGAAAVAKSWTLISNIQP